MPREDADAALIVERAMEAHGVRLVHGAKIARAESRGGERVVYVEVGGRTEEIADGAILRGRRSCLVLPPGRLPT